MTSDLQNPLMVGKPNRKSQLMALVFAANLCAGMIGLAYGVLDAQI